MFRRSLNCAVLPVVALTVMYGGSPVQAEEIQAGERITPSLGTNSDIRAGRPARRKRAALRYSPKAAFWPSATTGNRTGLSDRTGGSIS
ncbi:hypothetical protein [Streptomyces avidinii]